ncbi:hypothetical protein SRABI83_01665 [Arthrobacter sp. Bi83]|jgi:hypothetical protein|uniref:hypothetical protein n=1 Tax=Arthrobacter sp. Bi83 TaxID=2822353 RepID=UPI001DF1630D|nr:hypothetical protein [Arthrobacter sp. Bi83]CAH0190980.1 hypothetical protein SRABI83_01665 [Arthrobacter sp. Bi83]
MAGIWPTADRNPDLSAHLVEFAGCPDLLLWTAIGLTTIWQLKRRSAVNGPVKLAEAEAWNPAVVTRYAVAAGRRRLDMHRAERREAERAQANGAAPTEPEQPEFRGRAGGSTTLRPNLVSTGAFDARVGGRNRPCLPGIRAAVGATRSAQASSARGASDDWGTKAPVSEGFSSSPAPVKARTLRAREVVKQPLSPRGGA